MSTVTITKTQYETLKRRAEAYERIVSAAEADVFSPPPIRDAKKVVAAMRKTGRYSAAFLKSLESGLARTRHFSK